MAWLTSFLARQDMCYPMLSVLQHVQNLFEMDLSHLLGKREICPVQADYDRDREKYFVLPSPKAVHRMIEETKITQDPAFLSGIKTPILILTPALDGLVSKPAQAFAAATMQNATQAHLPGVRHRGPYDRHAARERLFAAMIPFIERVIAGHVKKETAPAVFSRGYTPLEAFQPAA